ncbi:glycosyltransferase family 2 protein [Patescibacteria group bacterium]|nr:glycosyltransferase family 2 protein [Patescibacteria group bacterium]
MPLVAVTKKKADIGIIILNYNNLHDECLSTLGQAAAATTRTVQVVIVDNNSTHMTADDRILQHLPEALVVQRKQNPGFARSINVGAACVNATHYFFLNPDTKLIQLSILDILVEYLNAHPDVGMVSPKITNFDGSRQDTCRRFPTWYQPIVQRTRLAETTWGKSYSKSFLMEDFDQSSERNIDWMQGSAFMMPEQVWHDVGGFDERYWLYFEDVDLCRRVWEKQKRVVYYPGTVLAHAFARTSATISNPIIGIMKNRALRGHIVSWIKYQWKWLGKKHPTVPTM